MDTQLDLSIVATIKDPDLRASLERLGAVMRYAAALRARAAITSQDHPVPALSRSHTAGIERHGPECAVFVHPGEGSPFHQGCAAGDRERCGDSFHR